MTLGAAGPCAFCLFASSSRRPNASLSLKAKRIGDVAGREVTAPDGMPAPMVSGGASAATAEDICAGEVVVGPFVTPPEDDAVGAGLEGELDVGPAPVAV